MDVVHTKPNYGLPVAPAVPLRPAGRGDDDRAKLAAEIRNVVTQTFGPGMQMQQMMPMQMQTAGDFDRMGTRPRATTGIPMAISGTATVVQLDVASALSSYSDPIRAILGLGVHEDQRVIIKRAYVSGGGASIVPERAPARTVSVAEDVREVMLTRYGADIEWNLNLLSRPQDFSREMNLKLAAQRASLQMELTKIGYDMLMSEGTSLVAALVKSNPISTRNPQAARDAAERIYATQVFGSMQKQPYPVHSLLAAAKYCTNYTIATADATALIVPHGMPEMLRYTKPANMLSYIHGTTHGDPISSSVLGGVTDVGLNTTIFVHVPPQNDSISAAHPTNEGSLLGSEVTICTFYTPGGDNRDDMVYDPIRRKLRQKTAGGFVVRIYKLNMLSAILAVPNGAGQGTGELLVGYPQSFVGTDVSTETGRLRLRTYLGSVLYRPEHVLVLPDVSFDGVAEFDEFAVDPEFTDDINAGTIQADGRLGLGDPGYAAVEAAVDAAIAGSAQLSAKFPDGVQGITYYQAATFNSRDRKQNRENTGHLGHIDSPTCGDAMHGGSFVYRGTPNPNSGAFKDAC
ncbi:MAG: hypothetical protein ACPGR8_10325 [Limisphaerales bacterium]